MKKIAATIKKFFQKVNSFLAGFTGSKPKLRPVPVRAEPVVRRR